MLGFILSKMQMLLFAVGIAVVALLFLDFVSRIGLSESARTLLLTDAKTISDQVNNDLLCSDKFITLPDALTYGFQNDRFFYDLQFSKQKIGSDTGELGTYANVLIMRIVEHKNNMDKPNIISSKSISSDAEFILIDPGFLMETTGLDSSYNKETISLYPRASSKNAVTASSPNSIAIVKEVVDGKKKLYIIPCSTEKEPGNCVRNIVRVGCYLLKQTTPADTDLVPSCFNKYYQISTDVDKSLNYNWANCKTLFPEVTG